jgi:hypothetical protein
MRDRSRARLQQKQPKPVIQQSCESLPPFQGGVRTNYASCQMLTGILLLDGPKMMLPGTPRTSADWLAAMQKAFLHTAGLITRTDQSHPIAAVSSPPVINWARILTGSGKITGCFRWPKDRLSTRSYLRCSKQKI